jgi:arylsulfatase A
VIVILADDLCPGDLGSVNGGLSRTPNLDRLRRESVWFANAYSGSPVCAPARAALLTGRYPHRTGVVTLNMQRYPQWTRLRRREVTLADVFGKAGYKTGLIGKWHCGLGEGYLPTDRGFDRFEGFLVHTHVPSYFEYRLTIDKELQPSRRGYLTEDLSQRAIAFVKRHRDQPFLLHLAHYAPHRPLGAPRDRVQPYLDAGLPEETATVYAMIEIMDEGIGKLLETLQTLGLAERTIVLFASDNGPDPLVASRFNGPRRGTKYMVNEGGISVPLMLRWPGTLTPSTRREPVHFVDWLPTLAKLADVPLPGGLALDGISHARGLLDDQPLETPTRFWQWNRTAPRYGHNAAIRQGPWKLVRPFVTRGVPEGPSKRTPRLYRLDRDPGEEEDLAGEYPERVESLAQALGNWATSVERDRTRP